MDPAVALVQAYLRVNGYFTVTEYPLFEVTGRPDAVRTVTDLDVLAFRFGRSELETRASRARRRALKGVFQPDPELGGDPERADMILAEVKSGRPRINRATLEPRVLGAGLARFGCCCAPERSEALARELLQNGRGTTEQGHAIRVVAFGSGRGDEVPERYQVVPMGQVAGFLEAYLDESWEVLRQVQILEPGLAMLHMLRKARGG